MNQLTNWACSILFLSLAFPFLIALEYHERIPLKTINIALGIYLITVATTARNLFIFFILLVFAMYMFSSYGAYKITDYLNISDEILSLKGIMVIVATAIALFEKWDYHVIKRKPFLPFNNIERNNRLNELGN